MKRPVDRKPAQRLVITAVEQRCEACGANLHVSQHRPRWIERLDGYLHVVRRDKKCPAEDCPGPKPIFHAPEDLRLALPYRTFGLDIAVCVGERHLRLGHSLSAVGRDLTAQGIPIDQRHVGRVLRDFMALAAATTGDEQSERARLRAQGGIVLMCDGVQFDDRSPVLYLAWDARSGTALFGERKPFRGEDDLRPLLERVKAMDVPIIGIVSDKEKGLVPAVEAVFPDVPYHLCHTHFLKNGAKPMESDLSDLAASVERRATRVQKIAKRLHVEETTAADGNEGPAQRPEPEAIVPHPAPAVVDATPQVQRPELTERDLAKEVCSFVRQNCRVSGKAPLDPAELRRHERLEQARALVEDAGKKGAPAAPIGSSRISPRP
jgi:hypothetical protein